MRSWWFRFLPATSKSTVRNLMYVVLRDSESSHDNHSLSLVVPAHSLKENTMDVEVTIARNDVKKRDISNAADAVLLKVRCPMIESMSREIYRERPTPAARTGRIDDRDGEAPRDCCH